MTDDPFGRDKDDDRDAFGNKLTGGDPLAPGDTESGSSEGLWARPQGGEAPAPGWLPPQAAADAPPAPPPASTQQQAGWIPPAGTQQPPSGSLAPGAQWPPPATPTAGAATGLASYAQRVGAATLDFFVRAGIVLAFVVLGAIAYTGGDTAGGAGVTIGAIIGGILALAYAPVMIARTGGQTLGHRAAGTRIVHVTGRPLTGGQAAVREVVVKGLLIDGLGGFFFLIPTLLNYLWPLWDANNEALHDKICSTRVVEA